MYILSPVEKKASVLNIYIFHPNHINTIIILTAASNRQPDALGPPYYERGSLLSSDKVFP